ncbi:hypothetical protein AAV94_13600 [Lampropedia cohaerens]|uniref:LPS export ABC transporter periplasmic protein LptC n=1 Tax=Lampropedia cohaerens TaxID=1610491 RepID=A0A0U1PW98_9BURK|nr:LPS export ABC transporter periplasmic protein LptC [Lampropedia cohaerens]KKW66789.1 hypothetical protein AAV94_13600 [Lampropedia cohaerens]
MNHASRGLRYRLEKLTVYAPALVMALLALATYWLLRTEQAADDAPTVEVQPDEPDYRIHRFAVRSYTPDGRPTLELFGDQARHYPLDDTLQVDVLRARIFTEDGRVITATADTGTSNGDGSHLQLRGNAVIIQQATGDTPRLEFRGEQLYLWPQEERVRSDLPVQLMRGSDRMTGERLTYDRKSQTMTLDGRVRTTLQPGSTTAPNR